MPFKELSMIGSKQLTDFLRQLDCNVIDVRPLKYNSWEVVAEGEEIPRLYKFIDLQPAKIIVERFLRRDSTLVCEWPFAGVDPREYLKEETYEYIAERTARECFYDNMFEPTPLDSEYKNKLVEKLVSYGIIPTSKLERDVFGKLFYRPLENDCEYDIELTCEETESYIKSIKNYYIAEYGTARKFVLNHFRKSPELIDGKLIREFDTEKFVDFLYYEDVKFTNEFFDMDKLLTAIAVSIIAAEYAKMDTPVLFGEGLVAVRQA